MNKPKSLTETEIFWQKIQRILFIAAIVSAMCALVFVVYKELKHPNCNPNCILNYKE